MTWVADASVTVAYLLGQATEVERAAMLGGDVHAPALVDVEVTQTLRGLGSRRSSRSSRPIDAIGARLPAR